MGNILWHIDENSKLKQVDFGLSNRDSKYNYLGKNALLNCTGWLNYT